MITKRIMKRNIFKRKTKYATFIFFYKITLNDKKNITERKYTRNRNEIITSLLANYSYTIEINTAKTNYKKPNVKLGNFNPEKGWEIIQDSIIDSWYSTVNSVPG